MMAERDQWDALLVIKMDRIHRNSRNFMEMMENLREWGKGFVSASESLDTSTAMGRFVMDIIQRIAQLESEQIGERVYMGMSQKAKVGPGILGFHPPLGYELTGGRLVPNAAEAEVVRGMFMLCLDGRTLEEIASDLNAEGRRTKRDTSWTPVKIHRIVHNPVYAGYLRWDEFLRKSDHKPLVSVEVFNEAQERLRSQVAECRGAQQRGEESERVPDLCESLWLRLCRGRPPGQGRGSSGRLPDFPPIPRGQGDREDLPGAQPGRIPDEDRARVGQSNDCEHPEQPGVLWPRPTERRDQTREARSAH